MMRFKIGLVLLASTAAACSHTPQDLPDRGYAAVNVPVLTRTQYVFDATAPGGYLSPSEAVRLDTWFSSLQLGYGDSIYVDGPYAAAARDDVARVAGNYGLMVSAGAPVTAGPVSPDVIRVVVSRAVATVPNCPNWSRPSQPNYNNQSLPNSGCSVNSNLAAMVANPEDLIHGREGSSVVDAYTSAKAVGSYRAAAPTGTKGLQDVNTKKDEK